MVPTLLAMKGKFAYANLTASEAEDRAIARLAQIAENDKKLAVITAVKACATKVGLWDIELEAMRQRGDDRYVFHVTPDERRELTMAVAECMHNTLWQTCNVNEVCKFYEGLPSDEAAFVASKVARYAFFHFQ